MRSLLFGHPNDLYLKTFHFVANLTLAEFFELSPGYWIWFMLKKIDREFISPPLRSLRRIVDLKVKAHFPLSRLKGLFENKYDNL